MTKSAWFKHGAAPHVAPVTSRLGSSFLESREEEAARLAHWITKTVDAGGVEFLEASHVDLAGFVQRGEVPDM